MRFFIAYMVRFLNYLNDELENIKERMKLEQEFLNSRDSTHFKEFLEAWEKEQEFIGGLIVNYRELVRDNSRVLSTHEDRFFPLKWGGSFLSGMVGGTAILVSVAAALNPAFILLMLLTGLGIGFVQSQGKLMYTELIEVQQDKRLLKHLESMGVVPA